QLVRKDASGATLPVDVAALVREVSQMCRRTFEPGIDMQCDAPAAPCFVLARRAELQQVVVNLCINARDALVGRPSPRLELAVSAGPEQILVTVTDNGAGMPPEVLRRLGEPFFSTKPPGRGTGLGLATAYGIVAEFSGSIRCSSAAGQGTRFELRLPRHRVAVGSTGTDVAVRPTARGLRVLIVDDEELVQNTLRRAVERFGAEVLSATRGSEALALLQANPDLDLVLLDLAMPEMDGVEVLRGLRAMNTTVPVYLMTGFLSSDVEMTGATGVFTKPIDITQVSALLARVAGPRGHGGTRASAG
ncbi:MAG TPA: ATP-binding protein, partial [Polyangiaceae bacterium]|nr:ATP-binding protein [Polyangiaceae bacterium]